MARSHGKILCSVWKDPEFMALRPRDQWAYFMLLSQPRLSLVGCIDYWPGRWATYADECSTEMLEDALDGLQRAGFVCIDLSTSELLVRTLTRSDGLQWANSKLRKGFWGAYEAITSATLRKVAVDNMPAVAFEYDAPTEAECFRRSARMDWAIVPADPLSDRSSFRPPPSTIHLPPSVESVAPSVDFEHHPPEQTSPEQIQVNRHGIAALKQDLHPPLHAVPTNPGATHA